MSTPTFKILRGLRANIDNAPKIDGAWYLTTDTYEMFVCVTTNDGTLEIHKINEVNLSNYVTFDDIPSFDDFARKDEIPTRLSEFENDTDFVNSADIEGLASKTFVQDEIAKAQLGDTDINLDGYVKTEQFEDLADQVNTKAAIQYVETKNDLPTVGQENVLYVIKDITRSCAWDGHKYYYTAPDSEDITVIHGGTSSTVI